MGQARIDVQIDVGYGDAVFPPPARITFPTLLDLPAPSVLAYARETVVAEKFHALVTLGIANSRMKDFYDLWLLACQFGFDGVVLANAIRATFEQRLTPLPTAPPLALTLAFSEDRSKQIMWRAFLEKSQLYAGEQDLGKVTYLLQEFLMPPAEAAARRSVFQAIWRPGGLWH